MKYRVSIDGSEREVDVIVTPEGGVSVALDGEPVQDLDVVRVPGGVSLRIGARVFDIAVGGKGGALQVAAGEARAVVEISSARTRARGGKRSAMGGDEREIRAPMPGRIVKILVAVGQVVEAGEPCAVIEAMKMENELRAGVTGTVAEVVVAEGVSVENQALLIRFE